MTDNKKFEAEISTASLLIACALHNAGNEEDVYQGFNQISTNNLEIIHHMITHIIDYRINNN